MDLVRDVVLPFVRQLEGDGCFQLISQANNSFEGWLKWELAAYCARTLLDKTCLDPSRIGVEARMRLQPCKHQDKDEKLIDFWIEADRGRYHYLELKMVFNNGKPDQASHNGWMGFLVSGDARKGRESRNDSSSGFRSERSRSRSGWRDRVRRDGTPQAREPGDHDVVRRRLVAVPHALAGRLCGGDDAGIAISCLVHESTW